MTAPDHDPLDLPTAVFRGVGPRRAQDLAAAGILTVGDFLCRLPRRDEDRSRLLEVSALEAGQPATVCGRVRAAGCGARGVADSPSSS